jgi:hypothetical protein
VSLRSAEIKVGDVNGDRMNEVVVSGLHSSASQNETIVMHFTVSGSTVSDSFYNTHFADELNSNVHNFYTG